MSCGTRIYVADRAQARERARERGREHARARERERERERESEREHAHERGRGRSLVRGNRVTQSMCVLTVLLVLAALAMMPVLPVLTGLWLCYLWCGCSPVDVLPVLWVRVYGVLGPWAGCRAHTL